MYHPFVSHCSASLKIGQKLLNDGSKTGKNGSKIGKYMAETKQKWLQTDKLGRKIYKVWRKRAMLAMFCFCTFCFPILFCQTDNLPPRNAYANEFVKELNLQHTLLNTGCQVSQKSVILVPCYFSSTIHQITEI